MMALFNQNSGYLGGSDSFLWFQVNENGGFGIEMGNCPFSCAVIGKYRLASFGF